MSLTVSPISNVSYCAQQPQQQSVEDILSRPGAFAKPEVIDAPAPKKHSLLKFFAGVLVSAGIVAGALYGLKQGFPHIFKIAENPQGIKEYLTSGVAKGAEYVEKGADKAVELFTKGCAFVKNLFRKNA